MANLVTPRRVLTALWLLHDSSSTFLSNGDAPATHSVQACKLAMDSFVEHKGWTADTSAPAARQNAALGSSIKNEERVSSKKKTLEVAQELLNIGSQVEGIDQSLVSFDHALNSLLQEASAKAPHGGAADPRDAELAEL